MRLWDKLETDVLADELLLDYSSMFGGEAKMIASKDVVAQWKGLIEAMDSTQHVTA